MTEICKRFPIFRLPTLPLMRISREMNLQDIFLLSLTSKKSSYIMRSLLPPNWFDLQLSICHETQISLSARSHWAPMRIKARKIGSNFQIEIRHSVNVWLLEMSVKSIINCVAIVFNPAIDFDVGHDCRESNVMAIVLNTVKHWDLSKKAIRISTPFLSSEHYKHILDEWSGVSELWLFCKVDSNFQYRSAHGFKVDELHISDGSWIYLEDYINCKKVSIQSTQSEMRSARIEVLRAFLNKWIESESQLEYLEILSAPDEMNFREIPLGVARRRTLKSTHEGGNSEKMRWEEGDCSL